MRAYHGDGIVTTARRLAEAEGWNAVTTRRLSAEIEYSQPVLYKHFSCMEDIVQAVAIEGCGELADMLRAARHGARTAVQAMHRIAYAFTEFAQTNPVLYDAMFIRATSLPFAADDTRQNWWQRSPSCATPSRRWQGHGTRTHLPRCSGAPCTAWPHSRRADACARRSMTSASPC